jgi:hypothetical protein
MYLTLVRAALLQSSLISRLQVMSLNLMASSPGIITMSLQLSYVCNDVTIGCHIIVQNIFIVYLTILGNLDYAELNKEMRSE